MKMKTVLSLALTLSISALLTSPAAHARCSDGNATDGDVVLGLITTTTAPPLTLTTLVACAINNRAEVNNMMIEREATMLNEENKIFVPSFLGAYADQHGLELREAAKDVLANGIRQ
ncbi:MAG: hypothetical protein AABZ55_01760 [Bdellovibrionota bacterium]